MMLPPPFSASLANPLTRLRSGTRVHTRVKHSSSHTFVNARNDTNDHPRCPHHTNALLPVRVCVCVHARPCVCMCLQELVCDTKRRPPVLHAYLRLNRAFHSVELKSRAVRMRACTCICAGGRTPSRISRACCTTCTRPDCVGRADLSRSRRAPGDSTKYRLLETFSSRPSSSPFVALLIRSNFACNFQEEGQCN